MRRLFGGKRPKREKQETTKLDRALARYKSNPMAPDATAYLTSGIWSIILDVRDQKERLDGAKAVLKEIRSRRFRANPDPSRIKVCNDALQMLENVPEMNPRPVERIRDRMVDVLAKKHAKQEKRPSLLRRTIPWVQLSVAVAVTIATAISFILSPCPGREDTGQRRAQITQRYGTVSLERITPNDSLVLKAIQKGTRKGSLSVSQILDAYDFVTTHIEYRNVPHPSIPRWPRETLAPVFQNCNAKTCKSVADCKSMAVVLASMLEGMGAETKLIEVPKHLYLAVLVSDVKTKAEAKTTAEKISRMIKYRYQTLRSPTFFTSKTDKGYRVYLALDPTTGYVPGRVNSTKTTEDYESRPGQGVVPRLK